MIGAHAVHQLALPVETLAPHAVKTLILAEVYVPGIVDLLEYRPADLFMIRVRCAYKVIVGYGKLRPQSPELSADPVNICLGIFADLAGRLGDLVAMLIGAVRK